MSFEILIYSWDFNTQQVHWFQLLGKNPKLVSLLLNDRFKFNANYHGVTVTLMLYSRLGNMNGLRMAEINLERTLSEYDILLLH